MPKPLRRAPSQLAVSLPVSVSLVHLCPPCAGGRVHPRTLSEGALLLGGDERLRPGHSHLGPLRGWDACRGRAQGSGAGTVRPGPCSRGASALPDTPGSGGWAASAPVVLCAAMLCCAGVAAGDPRPPRDERPGLRLQPPCALCPCCPPLTWRSRAVAPLLCPHL